jgi:hypothetical protein
MEMEFLFDEEEQALLRDGIDVLLQVAIEVEDWQRAAMWKLMLVKIDTLFLVRSKKFGGIDYEDKQ